jgi:hypothetical protein
MTIALFPDGTRVAVYDNGRVKVGSHDHWIRVDRKFGYRPGESGRGDGFVWLEFEPQTDGPRGPVDEGWRGCLTGFDPVNASHQDSNTRSSCGSGSPAAVGRRGRALRPPLGVLTPARPTATPRW